MASVFRASYKRTDPVTGKAVTKHYKHWTVKYKDAAGKWVRVKGYRDKAASLKLARDLEERAARLAVGLIDPFEKHLLEFLTVHLEWFEKHLRSKGSCDDHVSRTKARVQAAIDHCGWIRLQDISASGLADFLTISRDAKQFGKRTSNYYLAACKQFTRWLVKDRRAPHDPLAYLSPLNTEGDESRTRRAATAEQFKKLVDAARASKRRRKVCGADRAMLYMVASFTGFRAAELASLTPESFDLAEFSVAVEAGYSKRRRRDTQPLRPDLACALREWLAGKPPRDRLWPGGWYRKAGEMIQLDLKEAGIDYVDDLGRVLDFHGLRYTYITSLHRGGTYGRILQSLARHSTPTLTARYTTVDLSDVTSALGGLPAIPELQPARSEDRKTG